MPTDALIPGEEEIFGWIEEIFGARRAPTRLSRRPLGRELDRRAPARVRRRAAFAMSPSQLPSWEPRRWSLSVRARDRRRLELDCFPLPHAASTRAASTPRSCRSIRLRRNACAAPLRSTTSRSCACRTPRWPRGPLGISIPRNSFADALQVLPFGREFLAVMEPAARRRDRLRRRAQRLSRRLVRYYVPYDAEPRPLPGLWVRGSDGARLRRMLTDGPVRVRLQVEAVREPMTITTSSASYPAPTTRR